MHTILDLVPGDTVVLEHHGHNHIAPVQPVFHFLLLVRSEGWQ